MQEQHDEELTAIEELLIESAVEETRETFNYQEEINRLSDERRKMFEMASENPMLTAEYTARAKDISAKLEALWNEVRSNRAVKRSALENAVLAKNHGIIPQEHPIYEEHDEEHHDDHPHHTPGKAA